MSLWVSSEWWNVAPRGYGWKVQAKDDAGFEFERVGGTLSSRAARRAIGRGEKAAKRLWRTTPASSREQKP